MSAPETIYATHNQMRLAIHVLRDAPGPTLLLLHGLGEATPDEVPPWLHAWPGRVAGLDFTGHGRSTVPVGGGYSAELLMADVDAALALLGECTVYGRGLGAYVALLIAGGRPALVRGAILDDGPGLAGGSPVPGSPSIVAPGNPAALGRAPDPWALVELARDMRPGEYALTMLRLAAAGSPVPDPVWVVARQRPPWLAAIADDPAAVVRSTDEALAALARA